MLPGVHPGRIGGDETRAARFERLRRESEAALELVIRRALADGAEIDADDLYRRVDATFGAAGFQLWTGAARTERRESIGEAIALLAAEHERGSDPAEQADTRPELPITDDGLARALELAGWEVRWNVTARHVEARTGGGEWQECAGLSRDLLMEACAGVAVLRRAYKSVPWRINSPRLEDRLLRVVASRNPFEGAGTEVFYTVREWAESLPGGGRTMTLSAVLIASGVLQKFEAASRAPKSVFADAGKALQDLDWRYQSVRLAEGPRKRWCSPGPRVATQLIPGGRSSGGDGDNHKPPTGKLLKMKKIDR